MPVLSKRIDNLSMKLVDEPKERIGRFDNSSFTDAEKLLFSKFDELQEKYGTPLPHDIVEANRDLISKAHEILMKYTIGTFKFMIVSFFGNFENQRDKNIFDTFLYSFLLEVCQFLIEANKHPLCEDEFMDLMDKYDVFGKLRKLVGNTEPNARVEKQGVDLIKTEYSEDDKNERYNRV
jgi:hypothetical protein